MNIILPILSFLCGVMLTETASGSSEEGKPSPGVVQELWFGIPGASVKDLTHRKIFETAAPDVRTISHLDVENQGDRYGARYSARQAGSTAFTCLPTIPQSYGWARMPPRRTWPASPPSKDIPTSIIGATSPTRLPNLSSWKLTGFIFFR